MRNLNWHGIVAVIIAGGVSIAIAASFVGAAVSTQPIGSEAASVMSTMIGAAVGAIATYLGTRGADPRGGADPTPPPNNQPNHSPQPERGEV